MADSKKPTKLELLKAEADDLGMEYPDTATEAQMVEALKLFKEELYQNEKEFNKTAPAKAPEPPVKEEKKEEKEPMTEKEIAALKAKKVQLKATELVRIRVTCMNPAKSAWTGEVFTVGNSKIRTVNRFVQFNVPWHVERIVYNAMRERKCQVFRDHTDHNGNTSRRGYLVNEFNIEVLDNLTEKEIAELARRQAMAKGEDGDEANMTMTAG